MDQEVENLSVSLVCARSQLRASYDIPDIPFPKVDPNDLTLMTQV